jgi:RNA polymerase sigma factor (sigma-70 family)
MPTEDEDWKELIDGLRAGDPEAELAFWRRYGPALERVAQRRLAPKLQARVGPDDVAQSACRTFLRRARGGEFHFPDSAALWKVLCAIALTKVREQARFHGRRKRSVDREAPTADGDEGRDVAGTGPAPDEAVEIADQMQALLASLDEQERQVVELKLEDLSNDEVALRLNLSERTVRRALKRVEARLTEGPGGG